IILQSSDGVKIGSHRNSMGQFSEGFPTANEVKSSMTIEILPMDETAVIIQLLVQFWHLRELPTLEDLDFDTLLALAYAAEKNLVYSAMAICKIRLSESRFVHDHAVSIFYYALRHRYSQLADELAPHT
ncbi:hypothetical protein C8J56DRAFT_742967, partial [Mycena floridula]